MRGARFTHVAVGVSDIPHLLEYLEQRNTAVPTLADIQNSDVEFAGANDDVADLLRANGHVVLRFETTGLPEETKLSLRGCAKSVRRALGHDGMNRLQRAFTSRLVIPEDSPVYAGFDALTGALA